MKKYLVTWEKKYAIDVPAETEEKAIAMIKPVMDEIMADIDHDNEFVGHDRHPAEVDNLQARELEPLSNWRNPLPENAHAIHRGILADQLYGKGVMEEKCFEVAWAVLYEYLQDSELAEAIENILNDHTKDTSDTSLATHLYYWLCKKLGREIE